MEAAGSASGGRFEKKFPHAFFSVDASRDMVYTRFSASGCSAVWLAHLNGVQGVEGSNPFIPTNRKACGVPGHHRDPAFACAGRGLRPTGRPARPKGAPGGPRSRAAAGGRAAGRRNVREGRKPPPGPRARRASAIPAGQAVHALPAVAVPASFLPPRTGRRPSSAPESPHRMPTPGQIAGRAPSTHPRAPHGLRPQAGFSPATRPRACPGFPAGTPPCRLLTDPPVRRKSGTPSPPDTPSPEIPHPAGPAPAADFPFSPRPGNFFFRFFSPDPLTL